MLFTLIAAAAIAIPWPDGFALAQQPEASNEPAWRPEKSRDVLVLVQAYYDGAADLEARFKQTYWNPTYGEAKRSGGKLRVKRPSKMVWDYDDRDDADYYVNGNDLWMVEHGTRQVVRTSVAGNSEVAAALQFLFGGKALTSEFSARYADDDKRRRYGDIDHYVVQIRPVKSNSRYKGALLVVHATTGRVDSFVVYNTDGSSNYFQLTKVKTNTGSGDAVFEFQMPDDYVETTEGMSPSSE